ncbi:MAG: hypothetical protein VKM92_00420 [Cyanobacteriota bacterium]|nr:hypothetical protein [Cyanobacteriota bacterium]
MSVRINATLRFTRWEGQRFVDRIPRILGNYGQALGTQLHEEINTAQFTWPRTTRRRNGQQVSSPRDIYDTGEFDRSQTLSTGGRNRLTFRWNPTSDSGFPYARVIFTGYTTSKGTVVPGRDWITPALTNQPPARFFAEQWASLGR